MENALKRQDVDEGDVAISDKTPCQKTNDASDSNLKQAFCL